MSAKLIKQHVSAALPVLSLPEIQAEPRLVSVQEEKPRAVPLSVDLGAGVRGGRAAAAAPASDFSTAPEQAPEIIQAARQEAELMMAEAQARAAAIENEARARGLTEAQANAAADLNRAAEELRAQFTQSLTKLTTLRAEVAARAERDLVKLAIEIAKKVVQREVTVDHEVALTLARVALTRLHNRAIAKVRLHPDDYHYVSARREQAGADSSIEIIEDRLVGRGGCLVETEMGDIDARIEQQFAEIERNFLSG